MSLKKIKSIIKCFDMFSQPVTLRYSGQPQYQTLTGAICSIALIIVFVAVFTGTLTNTLNKSYISSTVTKFEEIDPTYYKVGTDSFIFAIGVTGINLNQGERWFDIQFQFKTYQGTVRQKKAIPLQKCDRAQWAAMNKNFSTFYDRLKLNQWLCPSDNVVLQLQGKYTSEIFKFYKILVKQCSDELNPQRPCVNSSKIDSFVQSSETFILNFYFVNTILNPQNHDYISHYIDDSNYFPFTIKTGSNVNIYLSSYTIRTDESIYVFPDYKNQTGGIILSTAQIINYEVVTKQYLKLNIRKSSLSLTVTRQYRKLDDTISYIGGLFSAIASGLLLMNLYNQFCFELEIAHHMYKYDKSTPLQPDKFNLISYLGYLVFLLLTKLGIKLSWAQMSLYHKSLEQVRKQIDIRLLLRKLQYVENAAGVILDEHQLKALHLHENLTLEQAEAIRRDYRFCNELQKYYTQLGLEQFQKVPIFESCPQQNIYPEFIPQNQSRSQTIPCTDIKNQDSSTTSNKRNSDDLLQEKQKDKSIEISLDQRKYLGKAITQFRACVKALQNQSVSGYKISQKILNNINYDLMSKIEQQQLNGPIFIYQNQKIIEGLAIYDQEKKENQSLTYVQLSRNNVIIRRSNTKKLQGSNHNNINLSHHPINFKQRKIQPKTIINLEFPTDQDQTN